METRKGQVKEVTEGELRKTLDDRRRDDRVPARLEVEVPLATWEQAQKVYTTNISKGGLLFTISGPAEMPATAQVIIKLPDGKQVSLESEVRHVARKQGTSDFEVGVQFKLSADVQRQLDDVVKKLGR
jgi:c-di-GMP-binding flagellar brake protein YcgR